MPYIGKQLVRGQNRELDDISSSFNGATTTFNLTVAGDSVTPGSALQLFISIGGVLQNPNTDFTVAGNQITFSTAPGSGLSFFGYLQGDAVDFNTPADGSVTTAKFGSNLTINVADLRFDDSDSSNWVALQAPATVSSNVTWTLPAADGTADQSIVTDGSGALSFASRSRLVRSTAVTASGTSVTFTGIPSWARKIIFTFIGLSTNGTADYLLRIGDSGGVEGTGYGGSSNLLQGGITSVNTSSTFGFPLYSGVATNALTGQIILTNYDGNAWVATGQWDYSNTTGITGWTAGYKGLSDTLDRVQILAANGTDAFDAGTINILYEG